jgi:2-oxoacid:acceptor oxidoreductase delta subunit (pyruvate/2-ketoisovalerate family)
MGSSLKPWEELPVAGALETGLSPRPLTGGWRTGVKPQADLTKCVNCLLCWLYCPDSAVRLRGTTFLGFDEDVCKGCELCAAVCPVDAIQMVAENAD